MKRWIMMFVSVVVLLQLAACTSAPGVQTPAHDLSYDMAEIEYFGNIFEEKSADEWDDMGTYTILLEGLHTSVLVDMDGRTVVAVHAYDQTLELGDDGRLHQDLTPVSISSIEGAVLVNVTRDYDGKTVILTKEKCFTFAPEGDISTQVYVREDGTLAYGRYWGHYTTSFEHWDTAPLDLCTSRDQFLYETGHAEILDGEVVLTPEKTVTVSDAYDLDAMFARAREAGGYTGYETVDELLAANKANTAKSLP